LGKPRKVSPTRCEEVGSESGCAETGFRPGEFDRVLVKRNQPSTGQYPRQKRS